MQPRSLSASTLKGDTVRNNEGQKLGHLEELVIDLDTGRVAYVVLASGGFLGFGDKYFAVPWDLLRVDTESKEIVVDIAKETFENAPGFDHDNWPDLEADHRWMVDVYRHYGSDPYWEHDLELEDDGPESEPVTEAKVTGEIETGEVEETGARNT